MSRFVLADLTAAKSPPQELTRIVPALPSVPVQPILLSGEREWSMLGDLGRYPWVLEPVRYPNVADLMQLLRDRIIKRSWRHGGRLRRLRLQLLVSEQIMLAERRGDGNSCCEIPFAPGDGRSGQIHALLGE